MVLRLTCALLFGKLCGLLLLVNFFHLLGEVDYDRLPLRLLRYGAIELKIESSQPGHLFAKRVWVRSVVVGRGHLRRIVHDLMVFEQLCHFALVNVEPIFGLLERWQLVEIWGWKRCKGWI